QQQLAVYLEDMLQLHFVPNPGGDHAMVLLVLPRTHQEKSWELAPAPFGLTIMT
ncbi:unnamed protein product, partial [marine sediment metagenome]